MLFERKKKQALTASCDESTSPDGVELNHPSSKELAPKYVYFDIRDSENAFAWMLTRRTLRKCGEHYFERCSLFNTYYMAAAAVTAGAANSYMWTGTSHYVWGMLALIGFTVLLSGGFIASAHFASKLQELVAEDR